MHKAFEDSYVDAIPPKNGNLMIEQRIKDTFKKDVQDLFAAFSSYSNPKGVEGYVNHFYDAQFTIRQLRETIALCIDTLDKLPSIAQMKALRNANSAPKDRDREKEQVEFDKLYTKERKRHDKLKDQFLERFPDKLNSYIKFWYEGVYGESISDLMPLGAFEKPALNDLHDARWDFKQAVIEGKNKLGGV